MTMGLDEEEECLVNYESDSSTGELINKSQEAEMKNATTGDAIIDIMGSDNDNEETSAINEKCNDGKLLWARSKGYCIFSLFKFVFDNHTTFQPKSYDRCRSKEGDGFSPAVAFPFFPSSGRMALLFATCTFSSQIINGRHKNLHV